MSISEASPMSRPRRADIQWLRAIAAISVVIWHTDLIVKHVWNTELIRYPAYNLLGGFGVELFFMLSGYSICMQVERVSKPREFLLTRAYRIYPLYWLFTGLMLLAFVVNPGWHLSARAERGPTFVFLSLFALPQEQMPLLPLGWTLELELVFYLMVAAAMATSSLRNAKGGLGWLLVALGFAGFVAGVDPTGGMVVFEIVTPFMAAFGFGWLLRYRESQPGKSTALFVGGAVAAILCLSLVLREREVHCAIRMIVAGLVMVTVMRLEPAFEAHPRLARPGCVIGNASFSIYLSHWFVLSILGKLLPHLPVTALGSPGIRFIGVLFSLAVGILVHWLIEERISGWISAWRRRGARNAGPSRKIVPDPSEPSSVPAPAVAPPPAKMDAPLAR